MDQNADVRVLHDTRGKFKLIFTNVDGPGDSSKYWKHMAEDGRIVQATVGNEKNAMQFETSDDAADAAERFLIKSFLPHKMKMMQFVDDVGYYTRRFTRIYVDDDKLYIGHTINTRKTRIYFKDIDGWVRYFDRI